MTDVAAFGPPSGGPLGLPSRAFWEAPFANRAAVVDRLSREDFRGLLIDAPPRLGPDAERWPLVGYRADSLRAWQRLGLEPHALLCAQVLGAGRCLVAPAFAWRPGPRRPTPREPEDPGAGRSTLGFALDLRQRLPAARWGHDRLRVRLILGDQLSNAVETGFGPAPWTWQDPAVIRFLAAERARQPPPRVWPPAGQGGVRYDADDDPTPGIALEALPRVPGQGAALVRGRWRLPLPLGHAVGDHDVGHPGARAVVPLTLVLVAEHAPGVPFSLTLQLPSDDDPTPAATDPDAPRPRVGGRFRLDLFQSTLLPGRQAGRYHLYAFSEQAVAGPASFDVEAP